jgi:hypothetical protein
VIRFSAEDIDSPIESIEAKFITFLDNKVKNQLFLCDGVAGPNAVVYDGCIPGTPVTDGMTWLSAYNNGSYEMLFIPDPNVNGVTKFLVAVEDDYNAQSTPVLVEVTVLPINDPPSFDRVDQRLSTAFNVTDGSFVIDGHVSDIDFKYGRMVALTIFVDNNETGNFSLPDDAPCNITEDLTNFTCVALITEINSWFFVGFDFIPADGVDFINVTLWLNDLGNVDKDNNPNSTEARITLNRTLALASLSGVQKPPVDNTLLIVAPIAGLIGACAIAGLLFFFRRRATHAVDDYFDRMALAMDGSVNASPLYEGAAKGGESVLYKGNS